METSLKIIEPAHGVPRRGYVLSTAVEEIAGPGRKIVTHLHTALARAAQLAKPYGCAGEAGTERTAWLAFAAWLLTQTEDADVEGATLSDAQSWFLGRPLTPTETTFWRSADQALGNQLAAIAACSGIKELLPYILETHGPGSRLSARRDPTTLVARRRKKVAGVFYTPPDVAAFMARTALAGRAITARLKVLDPAVGTGVFLRAVLAELEKAKPSSNSYCRAIGSLFGCDIDPVALDGAASVLLADTLPSALKAAATPLAAWQGLRTNLRQCDALCIDHVKDRAAGRDRLSISQLFPSVRSGFDLIIGNPPYANIGFRADFSELTERFETLTAKPTATADLYPVFVEQMIRLSRAKASGALVLPLSIAFNGGAQFTVCRAQIQRQTGTWRFAFFDRQPHALFGEDVKTRNAILFWQKHEKLTRLYTGPLRKWRGDDRRQMFEQIDYTEITDNITAGVPKIHGLLQAEAWERLKAEQVRLGDLIASWSRTTLDSLPHGEANELFVAPTAYNSLGVARPCLFRAKPGEALSNNPLIRLSANSANDAATAFAILSGNFAFWWWHVTGDGFHTTQSTLDRLPIGQAALSGAAHDQLALLGGILWQRVRARPVRSLNRGSVSYAFSAAEEPELRRQIDAIIVASLGLDITFVAELEAFRDTIREARLFACSAKTTRKEASMPNPITPDVKEKSKLTKDEWREYTKTVWSIANKAHPDHPAAFPVEIPHRLTKLFSFYGETVLDPFAGVGTTARAAIPLGRRAVCVEQNEAYVKILRQECAKLRNGHLDNFAPLDVVEGDSRNLRFLEDGSVSLIVTSPPYWDKADYGKGENNLGNTANYAEFLDGIRPVFDECYRVLAPGRKMCVVTANVNQHTDQGLLTFPLATDFGVMLRNCGFVMINEVIWSKDGTGGKWGSFGAQRPIFGSYPYPPNFLFKNVHEYILIFAKPSEKKTKGPKVKPYKDLMNGLEQMPPFVVPDNRGDHRLPIIEV